MEHMESPPRLLETYADFSEASQDMITAYRLSIDDIARVIDLADAKGIDTLVDKTQLVTTFEISRKVLNGGYYDYDRFLATLFVISEEAKQNDDLLIQGSLSIQFMDGLISMNRYVGIYSASDETSSYYQALCDRIHSMLVWTSNYRSRRLNELFDM